MSDAPADPAAAHRAYQLRYYGDLPDREAIRPVDTPFVRRHLRRTLGAAGLGEGDRVLEVGAGSGRFTHLMVEEGLRVHATELSPVLARALDDALGERLAGLDTCGVDELADTLDGPAPAAVGFFMLHHLYDLDASFRGLARALAPGARVAFCEPNGLNPLFYLQVLLSPSMTWAGDGGIRHMTPGQVLGAMERAGFEDLGFERYGVFPPFLANRPLVRRVERGLEALPLLPPCWAFQVFRGRWPGA